MLPHYYNHDCQLAMSSKHMALKRQKALPVNQRRVRGVMKSPLDLEHSRLSVHGLHMQLGGSATKQQQHLQNNKWCIHIKCQLISM